MKKLTTLLLTGVAALAFTACGGSGGGGSGGGDIPPSIPKESSIMKSSDAARHISIPNGEKIIVGGGALNTNIYDSSGSNIFSTTNVIKTTILDIGEYIVKADESTMIYNDGEGIIFYLTSNIYVEDLALNAQITIPKRSARIYQFNVENEGMYLISSSRTNTYIFNSFLNYIEKSNDGIVTLTPGTYYFVADTSTFILEGKFSVEAI